MAISVKMDMGDTVVAMGPERDFVPMVWRVTITTPDTVHNPTVVRFDRQDLENLNRAIELMLAS